MRRPVAVTAALAIATTAAPIPFAHATSSATFTKKANAACAAAGAKVEALPKLTTANTVDVLTKEGKIVKALVVKLDAITPPSAKATRYKRFVAVTREGAVLVPKVVAAIKAKDKDKANALAKKLDKAGKTSDALARGLKLSDCAKSYTAGGSGGTMS